MISSTLNRNGWIWKRTKLTSTYNMWPSPNKTRLPMFSYWSCGNNCLKNIIRFQTGLYFYQIITCEQSSNKVRPKINMLLCSPNTVVFNLIQIPSISKKHCQLLESTEFSSKYNWWLDDQVWMNLLTGGQTEKELIITVH